MGKWRKRYADPVVLAPMLHELLPVVGKEPPKTVIAYEDRQGRLRYAIADYANGWTYRLNFNARGEVSSTTAKMRIPVISAVADG